MKVEGMKDIGFIYGKRDRIVKTSVILSVTSWIEFMGAQNIPARPPRRLFQNTGK